MQKQITTYGNKEVNLLIETFKKEFELPVLDESEKVNRRYAWLMLKKCKNLDAAIKVIHLAASDPFYGDKISSFRRLYYRMVEIVQKARGRRNKIVEL